MFYVIGLGLGDAKDISLKGLEAVRKCNRVYLESYTSILSITLESLEEFYGCPLLPADRELVELEADKILPLNTNEDVAFLVVGDPFGATTHTDLVLRARQKGIDVKIIHNASILNAIGCCGLQLYSYGETVSIPYWSETWQPDSFYEKIVSNRSRGLHTLCLLDIKVKEPTPESITRKRKEYMPPKFMTVSEAATQLLKVVKRKMNSTTEEAVFTEQSLVVGLARVGTDDQQIVACSLEEMSKVNLGLPLHCLVIPAKKLHPLEVEFLIQYAVNKKEFEDLLQKEI